MPQLASITNWFHYFAVTTLCLLKNGDLEEFLPQLASSIHPNLSVFKYFTELSTWQNSFRFLLIGALFQGLILRSKIAP